MSPRSPKCWRDPQRSGSSRAPLAVMLAVLGMIVWQAASVGDPAQAMTAQDPPPQNATRPVDKPPADKPAEYETVSVRGEVVWLSSALERRFGIKVDPDAAEQQIALETESGRLIPLVKDFRGRGFHKDERLRNVAMELQLRIFEQSPVAQIVQVYTVHDGAKFELDYWCDICAIPMYELKACECCQGPTRLRERKVEEDGKTGDNETGKQ